MDTDALLLKKRIVEAAIDLTLNDPDRFTVEDVVEEAGIPKDVFYEHFDSLLFVLPAFYGLCLDQYRAVRESIDGYATFSLEERLSTFIYVTLDFLEEQQAFVAQTYDAYVVRDRGASAFREEVQTIVRELLDADDVPAANRFVTDRALLHALLARTYVSLVGFWIEDESPNREQSIALADKLVAFFAELATFLGIERGVDLLKYLVNVGLLKIDDVPIVGRWFNP